MLLNYFLIRFFLQYLPIKFETICIAKSSALYEHLRTNGLVHFIIPLTTIVIVSFYIFCVADT